MTRAVIIIIFSFFLFGCEKTEVNVFSSNTISGKALTFLGASSLGKATMSCAAVEVKLYKLNDSGNKISPEIATSDVNSSGNYSFTGVRGKIKFSKNIPDDGYLIESVGCSKTYSRMLTGPKNQDISFGTSLIGFTINTDLKDELADTHKKISDLRDLYDAVEALGTYGDAYAAIDSDPGLSTKFQNLFSTAGHEILQDAPPLINSILVPETVDEGNAELISVSSFHWSPLYSQVVVWKLGNTVISNSVSFNHTFSKDDQGVKTLTMYLGQDDGGGDLDLTKPYRTSVYTITVNNNHPPVAPGISVVSSNTVSRNINVDIDTGAALVNCETFSKLAITDGTAVVPDVTDFTINCTVDDTQTEAYTLVSPGEGNKTLRIWALDSSNNISAVSSSAVINLDTQAPVISSVILNGGNTYSGTPFVTASVAATDIATPIEVRLAEANAITGDCQSEYADNNWRTYTNSLTVLSYVVSNSDGSKKVCVWAKDDLGNTTVMAPTQGVANVNYDEIIYEVGNVPQITYLKLSNNSSGVNFGTENYNLGDDVKIEWTATDVEGLFNSPITIEYTTDNTTWLPVISDYGSLVGNPTTYSDSYSTFTAPSAGFFKLKIIAQDRSNNLSVPIISNAQNAGNWSVYAGTTDRGVGSSAASSSVSINNNSGNIFAINKVNNDIYFTDRSKNIQRMDSATGLTNIFINSGTNNLGLSGTINSSSKINTRYTRLVISNDGVMYLMEAIGSNSSGKIYAIDLDSLDYTLYAGGGVNIDPTTATPSDLYILDGPITVDESGSLYFLTKCETANWDRFNDAFRIVKLTQKPDKTADDVSHFAGNCIRANIPSDGPFVATASPLGAYHYPSIGDMTVWDNGNKFYFHFHASTPLKILNGNIYKTNLMGGSGVTLKYNPANSKLYVGRGEVREYTPNLTGANGATFTTFISGSGTDGDCLADGKLASNACINAHFTMGTNSNGIVFISDGPNINSLREYRIRYKDNLGKVRTVVGNLPFYGDGEDKSIMRGRFSGIYYKKATEPNQAAFPEGLYFVESNGVVMGYVDPVTSVVSKLFGSQKGGSVNYSTGNDLGPSTDLGPAYSGGNGMPLSFYNGLPYMKYMSRALLIDENKKAVRIQNNSAVFWQANNGDAASSYGMHVHGGMQNYTMKGNGIFVIGGYYNGPSHNQEYPRILYSNFDTNLITVVMGGTASGVSPDNSTPGAVKDLGISAACRNNGACYISYQPTEDRLYFVEGNKLRYINDPTNTANSTLGTLFIGAAAINNFIFKEDMSQLFYIMGGKLYCHDISSGKAWCNDTDLGPTSGLGSISRGANQFTWADSGHLLISNYQGLILKYKLLD